MATSLRRSIFIAGSVFCLIGWIGALIGPKELVWFGIAGFLCAFLGAIGLPVVPKDPIEIQTTTQRKLKYLSIVVGVAAFVCVLFFDADFAESFQ